MHRVLYDNAIEHEYHLVHGADHVGAAAEPGGRRLAELPAHL